MEQSQIVPHLVRRGPAEVVRTQAGARAPGRGFHGNPVGAGTVRVICKFGPAKETFRGCFEEDVRRAARVALPLGRCPIAPFSRSLIIPRVFLVRLRLVLRKG